MRDRGEEIRLLCCTERTVVGWWSLEWPGLTDGAWDGTVSKCDWDCVIILVVEDVTGV